MFVVCGEALWDLFGREGSDGLSFDARVGGSPFNVAVGLARLDQSAALLTGLSTDLLGQRLFEALGRERVSTSCVRRSPRPTTLSLVDLGPDGSPVYAFYGQNAADRSLEVDDLRPIGSDVWGLHAGSYSLVADPTGASLLALYGREKGRRLLTLDPNVRVTVEPDLGIWRGRIGAFVDLSDLVKVSEEDLGLLYPDRPVADVAAAWLEAGAALVIVTHGPAGATAFGGFGHVAELGRPVKVADTVGAGDSFMAATIAWLAEADVRSRPALAGLGASEVGRLLAFASDAAAITCTRRGADLPRRAELGTPST